LSGLSEPRHDGALRPVTPPRLAVARLVLTQFRSYARGEIETSGRSVVLAGPNGAGKTNVLDAISLLSPGKGLRGASLGDHTRKAPLEAADDALWAVAATVTQGATSHELGVGLGAQDGERRRVHLNGAPLTSSSELADIVQMVWLTPVMDRIFIEGASGRRKFLDRLVLGFDPGHARRSSRYETAMRERARLLKFGPRDPAWLDGLEKEMAETGIAIAEARAETVERLNGALAERGAQGAFPAAQLALEGETDTLLARDPAPAVDMLRETFARLRMRDAEARRTTTGPHLSDLAVRHTVKRMSAADCSTGEQKALLLSIVLADARELARRRNGCAPILLLDEVAAHLDSRRRCALFDEILALGAQAWMTGTDLSLFEGLRSRADIFLVNAGAFARQE
jgi:DNA replication and repair protein RecF